jgi:uncharacterized membrane protein YfcA
MSSGPYFARRRWFFVERYSPVTDKIERGIPADLPANQARIVFLWRLAVVLALGIITSIVGGLVYFLCLTIFSWKSSDPLRFMLQVTAVSQSAYLLLSRRRAKGTREPGYRSSGRTSKRKRGV